MGQDKSDGNSSPENADKAPASDIWAAVPTRTYDHMAKVARDAQSLLDALQSNVQHLRSGFVSEAPADNLAKGLRDIETCCERLNNMLEDALVGVRNNGLGIQRSSVSIASVVAASMKQVRASAEARLISFTIEPVPDVAARLDRTLLTRALAKLMGRIIAESDAGSQIAVSHRLERGEIHICLEGSSSAPRAARTSLRPREDTEADLEFCHHVAECHGGALTIGAGVVPVYRLALPWVV